MTVREFLESHTSRDLAELRAYELRYGPIGPQYQLEVLASIHEQLQKLTSTVWAVNIEDPDDAPEVVHYPRPYEVFGYEDVVNVEE
jgi:hypothetical protein